jgi:hypothetical protein
MIGGGRLVRNRWSSWNGIAGRHAADLKILITFNFHNRLNLKMQHDI